MAWYLGIDTSNYTTSVALWEPETDALIQEKLPLPVRDNAVGLRQSDAVFAHVKQLGGLIEKVMGQAGSLSAVGVSVRPRDEEGSYMPCFLVGEMDAQSISAANGISLHRFSHQAGHIAAALYATGNLALRKKPFLAFHLSGGTTECLLVKEGEESPFAIERLYTSSDLYAGQAVDRVGAMLGLPFPAGPALERLALESNAQLHLRIPMQSGNPSISGLENQCKKLLAEGKSSADVARYCIAWLSAMVQKMTENALSRFPGLPVIYAGGVMANGIIREEVTAKFGGERCFFAPAAFSADNAAGIAVLAAIGEGECAQC